MVERWAMLGFNSHRFMLPPPHVQLGPRPGFRRLRLTLAYDGGPWRGWQTLSSGDSVQDAVNRAFVKVAGQAVKTQGSGRTDAGVHALAQVAHADVPTSATLAPAAWRDALNACLPPSIRVLEVSEPHPHFHARYDAVGKVYRYRIWRPRVMDPFEVGRAWQVYGPLDEPLLHQSAERLLGTHNFARLSANRGGEREAEIRQDPLSTTRTLTRVAIAQPTPELLEIEFEGNGFLYKMVRLLVGSLMQVARGKLSYAWLDDLLERPTAEPKSHHAAPAEGLYLVEVRYE
jgi:tRNA pseudouridine38-40 synthase